MEELCCNCHKRPINKSRSIAKCDVCLDRAKKAGRKYYQEHKEKVLSYQESYYKKNSESIKDYSKKQGRKVRQERLRNGICACCGNNPISPKSKYSCESCLKAKREWGNDYRTKTDKSKRVQSQYKSVAKNPQKYRAIKEKYRQRHKDKWVDYTNRRRARKRGSGGEIAEKDWKLVTSLYGNRCLCCGAENQIERDHIVPISKGGRNSVENIQPLCKTCNRKKWNKTIDYRPFVPVEWTFSWL